MERGHAVVSAMALYCHSFTDDISPGQDLTRNPPYRYQVSGMMVTGLNPSIIHLTNPHLIPTLQDVSPVGAITVIKFSRVTVSDPHCFDVMVRVTVYKPSSEYV